MQDDLPQEVCAQDSDLLLLHKWEEGEPAGAGNLPEHLGEAVLRDVEERVCEVPGQGWVSGGSTELVGGAGPEAECTRSCQSPQRAPQSWGQACVCTPSLGPAPPSSRWKEAPTLHEGGGVLRAGTSQDQQGGGDCGTSHRDPLPAAIRGPPQPGASGSRAREDEEQGGTAATKEAGLAVGDREDNQPRPDPHPHPRRRRSSQALSRATLACAWTA